MFFRHPKPCRQRHCTEQSAIASQNASNHQSRCRVTNSTLWCFFSALWPILACIVVSSLSTFVCAESPLGRRSSNRQSDLIAALIEAQEFEVAEAICKRNLANLKRGEDSYAEWAIQLSSVLVNAGLATGSLDSPPWNAARNATADALSGYEDQPASPWLRFQELLVSAAENKYRAINVMDRAEDSPLRQQFLEAHLGTTSALRELADEIEEKIPSLSQTGQGNAYASDLQNLLVSIRKSIVESFLLVVDIYPAGSDDAIAAAVAADRNATELLESTTHDSLYRERVVRLLARAHCESQRADEAQRLLEVYVGTARNTDPETLAVWLWSLWMQGETERVAEFFRDYYGSDPSSAPLSSSMDLLRLRTMLDQIPQNAQETQAGEINRIITQWIELIGRRGGPYARRRAETELLRTARAKPTSTNTTLLVAEAGQRIRSNKPEALTEAAELLLQASNLAAAGNEPGKAFQWGAQAAAALNRAGNVGESANVLGNVAIRFATQPNANRYHLEAIRLLASTFEKQATTAEARSSNDSIAAKIEQMLLVHLRQWQQTDSALAARTWLLSIYEAEQRWQDAAQVTLKLPRDSVEWENAIEQSAELWRRAIHESSFIEARREIASWAIESWEPLLDSETSAATQDRSTVVLPEEYQSDLQAQIDLLIVLGLNRQELADHWIAVPSTPKVGDKSPHRFAAELRKLRFDDINADQLALSPPDVTDRGVLIDIAIARLVADGKTQPGKRIQLAKGIQRIFAELPPDTAENRHRDFNKAVARAWNGDWKNAAVEFERVAAGPPKDGTFLEQGASILMDLGNRDAAKRAAELWNRVAAGLKPGESRWYEARLGSAESLSSAGDNEEASKIAKYVLLLHPPSDNALKERFTRLAQPQP